MIHNSAFDYKIFEGGTMGKFSRQELEEGLKIYNENHKKASETGDWATWADIFTDDATYIEWQSRSKSAARV